MTERKAEILIHFIHRMPLYIGIEDQNLIKAFMVGFEAEVDSDFYWTGKLAELLEKQYGVRRCNMGWDYQLGVYATKHEIDWISSFKVLLLEVIESSEYYSEHLYLLNTRLKNSKKT